MNIGLGIGAIVVFFVTMFGMAGSLTDDPLHDKYGHLKGCKVKGGWGQDDGEDIA